MYQGPKAPGPLTKFVAHHAAEKRPDLNPLARHQFPQVETSDFRQRGLSTSTKMLLAIRFTGRHLYEGTVPGSVKARRRARNRAARRARRVHRK